MRVPHRGELPRELSCRSCRSRSPSRASSRGESTSLDSSRRHSRSRSRSTSFGEVTGRVSWVERGREREGLALLFSEWMVNKVMEWKEVSSRLMWVRVRMGRECWAFC